MLLFSKYSLFSENKVFFVYRISSVDQYEKLLEEKSTKNQLILDNLNNKHYLITREILHLLENGLKERIDLICPLPSADQTRKTVKISVRYFFLNVRIVLFFSGQLMNLYQKEQRLDLE